ncbi:hypothetical protein N7523_004119 [Penicillium sp. IBT 18751x]|nr:hypothetical protein N7523_004119 [Penicillium sp. IBT 18751x]
MPRMKLKTKDEDLARVRNNQRNCRARQKERIRDLEQKVQNYETVQKARLDDMQKKIELLSVENQLLKYFVESMSAMNPEFTSPPRPSCEARRARTGSELGSDFLLSSDYTFASKLMPSEMSEVQGSKSVTINDNPLRGDSMATSDSWPYESLMFDDQFLYTSLPTSIAQFFETLYSPEKELEAGNYSSLNGSELPALGYPAMDCNSGTSDLTSQLTVSCSEACELLIGYVRKKPDLLSLHFRLQDGYRNSLIPGEGCRVDYQLLFTVLSDAL